MDTFTSGPKFQTSPRRDIYIAAATQTSELRRAKFQTSHRSLTAVTALHRLCRVPPPRPASAAVAAAAASPSSPLLWLLTVTVWLLIVTVLLSNCYRCELRCELHNSGRARFIPSFIEYLKHQ